MDPEQTAPIQSDLGIHCLHRLEASLIGRRQKQTTFVVIGALRVKTMSKFHNS